MCGRYVLYTAPQKLKDLFGTGNLVSGPPRCKLCTTMHNHAGLIHAKLTQGKGDCETHGLVVSNRENGSQTQNRSQE